MELIELLAASAAYATGGLFMKFSEGLTRPIPVVIFATLFLSGAALQALGMRRADLGVAYILVLGLEAGMATVLSVFILHESLSIMRAAAILVIVAGVIMLWRT
ncbi:MAG TPA: SMR family transporter [Candidatus Binataceae bacterium]|nr:SMR family transporter [Candidatus Binataceae bacterium]